MESGGDGGLPRLLVFPGSLSSWRALIVAEELQVKVNVETVNMFLWEHLKPEHLELAPQGTIPTLVLPTGRSLIGQVGVLFQTSLEGQWHGSYASCTGAP